MDLNAGPSGVSLAGGDPRPPLLQLHGREDDDLLAAREARGSGRQAQRDVTRLHPPDGGHVKVVRPSEAAQANG